VHVRGAFHHFEPIYYAIAEIDHCTEGDFAETSAAFLLNNMSDERYEIRGKIGQGGVGAVYQAFDTHLNREVAIKRVLAEGGYEDQGEATKHLLKEATALSSVQHPHIVTVYDAGVDTDGPYVVMELIHGRTLDEMVERGTLTWDDTREVALQTQEALIAAQDLDLVHRDLKPSNVMVCWLPSGKFQVKIVDFGLAKFSTTPSLQTIDHGDAVFGSIFFMAPEQFERTPLDKRTDMYAMGCLYYYALTGEYPFTGDTAAQVMASHLQHHVTPLSEVRPDIPQWGADWIMWHLERYMDDRPKDSREALERFLILDKQSTQPITMTAPDPSTPDDAPGKPQFIFPSSADTPAEPAPPAQPPAPPVQPPVQPSQPAPPVTPVAAAPPVQPVQSVQPVQPTVPVTPQPISLQAPAPTPAPMVEPTPEPARSATAPQTILPPDAALSPHTKAQNVTEAPQSGTGPQPTVIQPTVIQPAVTPQPAVQPAPVQPTPTVVQPTLTPVAPTVPATVPIQVAAPATTPQISITEAAQPTAPPTQPAPVAQPTPGMAPVPVAVVSTKKGMPAGAKYAIIGMLALVVAVAVIVMVSLSADRAEAEAYNALMERAAKLEEEGKLDDGLELSKDELSALLNKSSSMEDNKKRVILRKCLAFAKGKGFDADPIIVDYITNTRMPESLRSDLFKFVMARRKNPSNISPLLEYAKKTTEVSAAVQAIKAAQASAKGTNADEYFRDFLSLINNAEADSIRSAAEIAASDLVSSSENKDKFGASIMGSYESAVDDSAKYALLRLLGAAGGEQASKVVNESLKSDSEAMQNAAIASLGRWVDDSQFETLTDFISDTENKKLRQKTFDSAYSFLRISRKRNPEDLGDLWRMLAGSAQTQYEKLQIIRGMANQKHEWAIPVLEFFTEDKDDIIIDKAEQAKEFVERRIRESGGRDKDEDKDDE